MSLHLGVIILYTGCLTVIFLYSLVQLHLVVNYRRARKKNVLASECTLNGDSLPFITVQLPIYNERYVAGRLLDCIKKLDYPKDSWEIQVLDDSTDDTKEILFHKILELEKQGYQIVYHHRTDRKGFKAGALKEGLSFARGELIALFDADFLPHPGFLKATLPHFQDEEVGMVQTRWGHLNKDYSLLTRLQAFGLNAHFTVEQRGRNAGDFFINFNGTAGIWRKECILDAGNWHADTLTEDLDLSYRAQLKGWKFKYLENVESPAELPVEINAFKSQQFRWTKGAAETAKKMIPAVIKAPLSFTHKTHSFFHLLNSSVFICVLLSAILSVPMLWIKHHNPDFKYYFHFASFFLVSLVILGFLYWETLSNEFLSKKQKLGTFFRNFPVFLAVMMGLSLHNSLAAIEGFLGIKTPFVRTPKFNITGATGRSSKNIYIRPTFSILTFFELLLAAYFLFAIYLGIRLNDYALILYHFMLFFGFGLIVFYTVHHAIKFEE
jgi:cellulose synthase/poly-beta-1,6-N-acetylglucosamine synthase-like glycosyltransferase